MRLSVHFIAPFFLLCATASVPAAIAATERITEAQIHQILEAIDAAAMERNAEGIVQYFARDCIIRLEMPGPHGRQVLQVNREEYATSLKESFSTLIKYEYLRMETKIHIGPDGKSARVTGKIYETMTVEDRIIKAVTQHTAIFEHRSGELSITSLDTTFLSMEEERITTLRPQALRPG
ncbi:MAG: hypothetical protein ACE5K9_10315 [Candidatus Methylomirabilales bacterium]